MHIEKPMDLGFCSTTSSARLLIACNAIVLIFEAQADGAAMGSALQNQQEPTFRYEFQTVF